ncbi:MAG: type I-E CRISPR-associated protein Cas6/Cse3/CasE [Lautropia sp.]|nr:type I-E CRISPR-associated protein Cas6/Cse3/CasE [Lautropia sp.]
MTHFFSHVRLATGLHESKELRALMRRAGAYSDHALIWRLFPGDDVERDFVFRGLTDAREFYVVSAREPQNDSGWFQIRSKVYQPALAEGDVLHFDLRANPVVSRRTENGRSVRHDILMDTKHRLAGEGGDGAQLKEALDQAGGEWLLKRAEQWGLEVEPASVIQSAYTQHHLRITGKKEGKERSIRFSSLDYQGVAKVVEPDLLKKALLHGVGHAKGFGCGLLLVRRLS